MQRLLLMTTGAALVLFAVSCSGGSSPPNASPGPAISSAPENTTPVITNLEKEWVAAIVKKDTATIDRLLADDFSGTTDDQIYSKADAIEDVKNGTHESLELDNIKVRLFGDTAVVTMGQTEKSKHGETDFSGHYLFTDVWARKNGQWLAVASHGSRVR
jgi:ketosteroid isomerase-like protein